MAEHNDQNEVTQSQIRTRPNALLLFMIVNTIQVLNRSLTLQIKNDT